MADGWLDVDALSCHQGGGEIAEWRTGKWWTTYWLPDWLSVDVIVIAGLTVTYSQSTGQFVNFKRTGDEFLIEGLCLVCVCILRRRLFRTASGRPTSCTVYRSVSPLSLSLCLCVCVCVSVSSAARRAASSFHRLTVV